MKKTNLIIGLIVLIILLGGLLILFWPQGPLPQVITCRSNPPNKLNVVFNRLSTTAATGASLETIMITNATSTEINNVIITGVGAFANNDTTNLPIGNTTLNVTAGSAGSYRKGVYTISYTDSEGLKQTVTITCQGRDITITA